MANNPPLQRTDDIHSYSLARRYHKPAEQKFVPKHGEWLTCSWFLQTAVPQGPIANLNEHLANPAANNAWNYATKFTPGN